MHHMVTYWLNFLNPVYLIFVNSRPSRPIFDAKIVSTFATSVVHSKLDCCNSLYYKAKLDCSNSRYYKLPKNLY